MKLMFISDIHGSQFYLEKVLQCYTEEKPDQVILLGDILYHGPRNPLPEGYAPKDVIATLNPMKKQLLAVRGNCDTEVDQMVLEFPILADYIQIMADEHKFFVTHGHLYNSQPSPLLSEGDIFIQGHTHVPMIEEKEGVWHINPGSISLPKENHPHTYGIYENGNFEVKTLDQKIYMSKELF